MDGNEECLAEATGTSVAAMLSTDNIVTVSELPILQDTNLTADGTIGTGSSTVINVPIIRDGAFINQPSQGIVFTSPDGTKTLFLDSSQLAMLTNASNPNETTIFDVNGTFSTTETLPVISSEELADKTKFPCQTFNITQEQAVESIQEATQTKEPEIANKTTAAAAADNYAGIQPPIRKGVFHCEFCDKVFVKWNQYQKHRRGHANDKPHQCKSCSASFNLEINLRLHEAIHNNVETKCPECFKTFGRLAGLKAHLRLHEEEDNVACSECQEEFNTFGELDRHMKEHQSETMAIVCKKCHQEFSRISLLKEHMKTHYKVRATLNNKSFKKRKPDRSGFVHACEFCTKTFQKPSQLVRHKRIHTGERPFVCEICKRAFNQKATLRTHMAMHFGNRPHRCDFCNAYFSQKGNLRAHVKRVHDIGQNGQNVFHCEYCSCMFRKLGNLNAHISKMHAINEILQLSAGGDKSVEGAEQANPDAIVSTDVNDVINQLLEISMKPDNLERTQQIRKMAEDGQVSADILQQALENSGLPTSDQVKSKPGSGVEEKNSKAGTEATNSELRPIRKYAVRKEYGIKWHQCPYCSKEFKKPSDLIRHIRIHTHEKPYKCTQCYRAFTVKSTLTAHIRTHFGIKDHRCDQCNKLFSASGSLKVHMRLHTGQKPYGCHVCDKTFRTLGHCKTHIVGHSKQFGKALNKKSRSDSQKAPKKDNIQLPDVTLQEPILITDTGAIQSSVKNTAYSQLDNQGGELDHDRPYKCQYCSRGFKKSSHLKQHVRSHTGEKPFKCFQCMRSFVSNGVLKEHMRTHSGIKSFKCDLCSMTFTTNGSLKRHMCSHSEARPFMCPYCQKTFKTLNNCKKHMKIHKLDLAVRTANSNEEKDGSEGYMQDNVITLGVLESEPTELHQTTDPLTTNSDFIMPSSLTESFSQLQQSLDQHVYGDQNEMNAVVSTPLSGVDQSTLNNLTQSASQPGLQGTNSAITTSLFDQPIQTSKTISTVSTVSYPTTNTFTISVNGINTQFAIQGHTLDIQELANDIGTPNQQQQAAIVQNQAENVNNIVIPSNVMEQKEIETTHPMVQNESNASTEKDVVVEQTSDLVQILPNAAEGTALAAKTVTLVNESMKVLEEAGRKFYRCSFCAKEFKKSGQIKLHIRTHTGEKPYKCDTCEQSFISFGILKNHQKVHSKNKQFKCQICEAMFTSNAALARHIPSHGKVYKCMVCNEEFQEGNVYKKHIAEKHPELEKSPTSATLQEIDNTQVEDTESGSTKQQEMRKSVRSRVEIIRLSEEQANAIAKQNPDAVSMLSEKMLIASAAEKNRISEIKDKNTENEEPRHANKCCVCPRSFKKPSDLVRHVRIHTGEKPFTCDLCMRSFTVKSTLDSHLKTHNRQKQYHCHVCNTMYSTKGSLKVHMRLHTGARPFKCPTCGQRFRTSGHRKSHMQTHARSEASQKKGKVAETTTMEVDQGLLKSVAGEQVIVQHTNLDNTEASDVITVDPSVIHQIMQPGISGNSTVSNITLPADFFTASDNNLLQPTTVEGLQLQVPGTLVGQNTGIQLDGAMSQTIQIDSNFLQQLQEQGNVNITINSLMQPLIPAADPNLLQNATLLSSSGDIMNHNPELTVPLVDKVQQVSTTSTSDVENTSTSSFQVSEPTNITQIRTGVVSNEKTFLNSVTPNGSGTVLSTFTFSGTPETMKKFVCDVCHKRFKRAYHLKVHKCVNPEDKLKTKVGPQKCNFCDKSFPKPSQLQRHKRIHTGERPFECLVCRKTFNQSNALQVHMKTHASDKLTCPHCAQSFPQKTDLSEHICSSHGSDKKSALNTEAYNETSEMLLVCNAVEETAGSMQGSQIKPENHDTDISHNTDYLDGVVGELFPQ